MNKSDSDTQERTERWAAVGRDLAHERLELEAEKVQTSLGIAARAASEGDLTAAELRRCYEALEDAELLLDQLAEIPDGFERAPKLCEMERDAVLAALERSED